MRTLIDSALRYLVNKLTSSSGLKLNKRALELLLSSRPQYVGHGAGTNPRYKRFLSVNVVINHIITDFKHYIRAITDFTQRYNRLII